MRDEARGPSRSGITVFCTGCDMEIYGEDAQGRLYDASRVLLCWECFDYFETHPLPEAAHARCGACRPLPFMRREPVRCEYNRPPVRCEPVEPRRYYQPECHHPIRDGRPCHPAPRKQTIRDIAALRAVGE